MKSQLYLNFDSKSSDVTKFEQQTSSLKPFLSFYGGKWREAKKYPKPLHDTIVEPFAGSAGYSVRYSHLNVILCDADPIIASIWQYLTRVSSAEILALPDIPDGADVNDIGVIQEAAWLIGFWLNAGSAQPRKTPSKWMRDNRNGSAFWGERVRRRIAKQVNEIRHWKVYNCSYENCPDDVKATWFVDPPYQEQGRHYKYGSDDIDFNNLSNWCRSRIGQTIVCENEGANWLPFKYLYQTKSTIGTRKSNEVMWTNTEMLG